MKKWVQKANVEHGIFHEGTFNQTADKIVKALLEKSKDVGQAIRRLVFYINRAGENLPNKVEVMKALVILKKKKEK